MYSLQYLLLLIIVATSSSRSINLSTKTNVSNALYQYLSTSTNDSSRKLQTFDALNEIFAEISLDLPDATVDRSGLEITITELVCRDLNVRDIQIDHEIQSPTSQKVGVDVIGIKIMCNFRYAYRWTIFSGEGAGNAVLDPTSNASIDMEFKSKDYTMYPPADVDVAECRTDVQIADMNFDGDGVGILSGILNLFEGLLRDTIEGELNTLVCNELSGLGDDALDEFLLAVSTQLDVFLEPEVAGTNPLYFEDSLELHAGSDGLPLYLDFQEMKNGTGLVGSAWEELDKLFTVSNATEGVPFNNIMRDYVLQEDGMLEIDPSILSSANSFFNGHDILTETSMSIKSIKIKGLDSFTKMDVLKVIGKHTLWNSVQLDYLDIVVEIESVMKASSKDDAVIVAGNSPPIKELFTVDFKVTDITVDFSIFLGINLDTLGNLQLGSVLDMTFIFPCLLNAIDNLSITELSVKVEDMVPPTLSGFLDPGVDYLISKGAKSLFHMYEAVLIRAMPNFFDSFVREKLNEFLTDFGGADGCPEPDSSLKGIVDFRALLLPVQRSVELLGSGDSPYGSLVRSIYGVVEKLMTASDENGLSQMNSIIKSMTASQSNVQGDLSFPGELFGTKMNVALNGLNAAIELSMKDLAVTNIDTLGVPITLLQPMKGESSVLNNSVSIGVSDAVRTSFTLKVMGKGDEVEVNNELELGISMSNVDMILELLAEIQEEPFLQFPVKDITNMNCWLATVVRPILYNYGVREGEADSGIVLRKVSVAVAEAGLDMKCIECTSPLLLDMQDVLSSQKGIEDTTLVANNIFEYLSKVTGGDWVQTIIDKAVYEAGMKCPHSPTYDKDFVGLQFDELVVPQTSEDSISFLIAIIAVVGTLIVVVSLLVVSTRWVSKRRHQRWHKMLSRPQLLVLEKIQLEDEAREKDLNGRIQAMVISKDIPVVIRLFIPFVILGNIALFLSGHLSLGGTVNISGGFAGQSFNVDGFFEFSMVKSTIEMWNAGARALAILIVIFSGVWPYTKQLITLVLWFLPTTRVSSKRRGKILRLLDVLGKWSMIDVFVLLMTLASFRVSVENPDISFLPEGLYSLQLLVVPLWGLYANMLAQLTSQISSHVIIHYHRKSVKSATSAQATEWNITSDDETESLSAALRNHQFKLDYEASTKRAAVRKSSEWVLCAALMAFVALVICGCVLPSFSIETLGLVGLAVESGQQFQEAKAYYSVLGLAKMIMDEARYLGTASDFVGLGTLASLLVITAFLVPLAQSASLCVQWFFPTTKKQRKNNLIANEILSAWQYMEVYVSSIIVAAWQLGGVSEYMINAYCGSLQNFFTGLSYFEILKEEDAQCFRVNATVEMASWILVAASILLLALNHFISTASRQKVQDEDISSDRRFHSDRWIISTKTSVMSEEDEEAVEAASPEDDEPKIDIAVVPPRFTDYYFYAIIKTDSEEFVKAVTWDI
mmetsp:Transcript_2764/g.4053  ORF Transcript_2764/g.4053 Transcript_2764/m.4053 type:complete len:1455 (+) Transcript_2764:100-4464(+)